MLQNQRKAIREQLAQHRHMPACNECHRKIDPPGFALKNFDPIGQWRTAYSETQPVDASGVFQSGETFHDVAGLKKILVHRKDPFARSLIEELLTYGTGRHIEAVDRPEIDRLLDELKRKDYRLRDLLMMVIRSSVFQSR